MKSFKHHTKMEIKFGNKNNFESGFFYFLFLLGRKLFIRPYYYNNSNHTYMTIITYNLSRGVQLYI